jgi:hypothetical protein
MQAENEKAKAANGGDPIVTQTSERALLSYLLTRLHLLDPDIIVGHNIGNWDLNILLVRMQLYKVLHWSRVGRIKRQRMPNLTGGGNMYGGGASQVRIQAILEGGGEDAWWLGVSGAKLGLTFLVPLCLRCEVNNN